MAKPTLVLYVDVVSPFAYLAFHVITVSGVCQWHNFIIMILFNFGFSALP